MTPIGICSNALIRLSAEPIEAFDEGTTIANTCEALYFQKKHYIMGMYPWRFTMKFMQLSRLVTTPLIRYKYEYALPSDRVQGGMPFVVAASGTNCIPTNDYEIIGNKLMCDLETVFVQYQYDAPEEFWPFYFTELIIEVMKTELVYPVTENGQMYQETKMETYGTPSEMGQGGLIGRSMFIDSRDNPTQVIDSNILLNDRF